jgi:hypothetical protein
MCEMPSDSLPETIRQFNERFGRTFDVNAEYSRTALQNMATIAIEYGEVHLARMLSRHALMAKQIV